MTKKFSLDATAREQLERARRESGRSAVTLVGGHEQVLRQTVIALTAGTGLQEHVTAGEATLQVLKGRVRLTAGDDNWEGRTGDLLIVPGGPHSLSATEDAAVVLTVARPAGPR